MILAAGIIVVRKIEGKWLYLLLRAYNYWDFPKGEPQKGEKPLQTACREVREETGLTDLCWRWGEIFMETQSYSGGRKRARYYLAATSESKVTFSVNPELGRPEHHEYRWVDYAELKKLAPARIQPIIDWAHRNIEGKNP
jgi:8-oxo-dGTP pyrophosphatase MutT (NUDIX family)